MDGNLATRWACGPAGATSAWLQLDFPQAVSFNQVFISEAFDRTRNFTLRIWDGQAWQPLASGTTLGTNYSVSFPGVTTDSLRLDILQSTDAPTLWEIQANYVPPTAPPGLNIDAGGGAPRVSWLNGFLQRADSLVSLWADVPGAVSPWAFPATGPQAFFRVRR